MGGSKKRGQGSPDFEINIAPIIDCFVVLIAFLLISSSYLAIGILDAGVQAGSVTPETTNAPAPVSVVVSLETNGRLAVKLSGARNEKLEVPAGADGRWDWSRLTSRLTEIKHQWPAVDGLVLTANPDTEYRDVVLGMEVVRKTIPNVLLGEF